MAHQAGKAKPLVSNRVTLFGIGSGSLLILLSLLLVFVPTTCDLGKSSQDRTAPEATAPRFVEFARVAVQTDRWSSWVSLPPGRKCRVDTPGDAEVRFWNDERIHIKDKEWQWFNALLPHSIFRLKGKAGEAVVYVEVE